MAYDLYESAFDIAVYRYIKFIFTIYLETAH